MTTSPKSSASHTVKDPSPILIVIVSFKPKIDFLSILYNHMCYKSRDKFQLILISKFKVLQAYGSLSFEFELKTNGSNQKKLEETKQKQ